MGEPLNEKKKEEKMQVMRTIRAGIISMDEFFDRLRL